MTVFTFMFKLLNQFQRPVFSRMTITVPSFLYDYTTATGKQTAALDMHNLFPMFPGTSRSLCLRYWLISRPLSHSIFPCNSITPRHVCVHTQQKQAPGHTSVLSFTLPPSESLKIMFVSGTRTHTTVHAHTLSKWWWALVRKAHVKTWHAETKQTSRNSWTLHNKTGRSINSYEWVTLH